MTIFYHSTSCKFFTSFMFDCLSEIKIIGFETYFYFSHQPQFSLLLQAASETAYWNVESMITVNGNTIIIMCLIKLIWTDWNIYQNVIECCLVSCNRKGSLLQADILKFANSLNFKISMQTNFFWTNYLPTIFPAFPSCKQFFVIFGTAGKY